LHPVLATTSGVGSASHWLVANVYDPSIAETTYTFQNEQSRSFMRPAGTKTKSRIVDGGTNGTATGPEYRWLMRKPSAVNASQFTHNEVTATVSLAAAPLPLPHYWKESVGSGHALLGTRADWQAHM
jgi:hypothetical protein